MVRFIFFPSGDKKTPKIIYVDTKMGDEYRGSTIEQEVLDGRMAFYPVTRCQFYSDELWIACQKWLFEREEIERQYDRLMKKGIKAISPNTSSTQL